MNEGVVVRKENAKTRVRVVPADDALIRIVAILNLVDMLPSVLGERNVRAPLRCALSRNARFYFRNPGGFGSYQDATDFCFSVRARMLANLSSNFGAELQQRRVVFFALDITIALRP
jgi:hypothetical protein